MISSEVAVRSWWNLPRSLMLQFPSKGSTDWPTNSTKMHQVKLKIKYAWDSPVIGWSNPNIYVSLFVTPINFNIDRCINISSINPDYYFLFKNKTSIIIQLMHYSWIVSAWILQVQGSSTRTRQQTFGTQSGLGQVLRSSPKWHDCHGRSW